MNCVGDWKQESTAEAVSVRVAEGSIIKSTHRGTLFLPGVGHMTAHLLPNLHASLLSVSSLVNAGLKVLFEATHVRLLRLDGTEVLAKARDPYSGLWFIDLEDFKGNTPSSEPMLHTAAPAVRLTSTDDHIDFWHKTFGSPAIDTFTHAVDRGWIKIPGITATLLRRHPPHSLNTSLGHLTATRQNLLSTKPETSILPVTAKVSDPLIFSRVYKCTGRMHSDAAGRFPIKSLSGKLYMIIFYSEDKNYIHIECTASRNAQDLLHAFKNAVTFFESRNCQIRFARMGNEFAQATKDWAADTKVLIELVPPGQHRINGAERAI